MTKIFVLFLFSFSVANSAPTSSARELRRTPVVEAVEKVSPTVVNIATEGMLEKQQRPYNHFGDGFFDQFFLDFFQGNINPRDGKKLVPLSLGSGVLIDSRGYIITNEHVILKASIIKVKLSGDKTEFMAKLIGSDPKSDIAVLKIDKKNISPITVGNSDDVMIGETVIAIGNPFNLSHTVTTGVVSAINRTFRYDEDKIYRDLIQTDASINPGNSGGPLLNILGEMIGINSAIHSKAQGIGFAIPSNRVKAIFDELLNYGEVKDSWLGVRVQNINGHIRRALNYNGKGGLIVTDVEPNSPVRLAEIERGDIIVSVGGQIIENKSDYYDTIKNLLVGEHIGFEYFRDGKVKKCTVIAKAFPTGYETSIAWNNFGISVSEKVKDGAYIEKVRSNSGAKRTGLERGDIIRQLDSWVIGSKEEFYKAILKVRYKDSIIMAVQRASRIYFVTVELN